MWPQSKGYWKHLEVRHIIDVMHVEKNVCDIKVPSGYFANIKRLVSMEDLKLIGMKSHDCHVLMTQMLPVAIRNILPPNVQRTVTKLCGFFNTFSKKFISLDELDGLQDGLVKTICELEMFFPRCSLMSWFIS